MSEPTVIAHISDLHCGSRYHSPSLASRVVDELNELEPDIVIVTGDLTDMGDRGEFKQAHRMLARISCENKVVLLGNHDARNVGDVHFEELFGESRRELVVEGMRVIAL
ncbi:MAG: metallophosphoesterase family protein, partial [Caulobacteraceae bacterium]